MWCIGALTQEYRQRTYSLLALYAKLLQCDEPVVCIDENFRKSFNDVLGHKAAGKLLRGA